MKYLIIKGWLGFGDRLESLKMAIDYALHHKLTVYVDWRDSTWSHGNESFYTYFKLINIPQISSLSEIPSDATVYPEYWKDHLEESISNELVSKQSGLDLGLLHKEKTFPADVVVMSSIGARLIYPNSAFFANVFRIADSRILEKVNQRKQRFPIHQSWGIHIRGTDRLKPNRRDISIQSIVSVLVNRGALNGQKMTVVSDDKDSIAVWKRFFPDSYITSELSLQQSSNVGNHHITKDKLQFTKDEMNVDMLVDFFTLTLTQQVFSTYKDSRFAQEARRLHPFVNAILGQ
jgi:hypothetical protein